VNFLGVKFRPIKGKEREKHIRLLPGELGIGSEVELEKKNRLMLKKVEEDVIIVAQTQQNKHPVFRPGDRMETVIYRYFLFPWHFFYILNRKYIPTCFTYPHRTHRMTQNATLRSSFAAKHELIF